jgi:hypothetical protein
MPNHDVLAGREGIFHEGEQGPVKLAHTRARM